MILLVFKEDDKENYAVVSEVTEENVIKVIDSFMPHPNFYKECCKDLYIDDNYGTYFNNIEWKRINFFIEEVSII